MKCCVPQCGFTFTKDSLATSASLVDSRITLHELPTIPYLRHSWLTWLKQIGVKESDVPERALVCSQHFKSDYFQTLRDGRKKLMKSVVPTLFKVANMRTVTADFCLICLDHDTSRLILMQNNNTLAKAYAHITGLEISILQEYVNNAPKLCPQCAHTLLKYYNFKNKVFKSHSILIHLTQKDKFVTLESLKSVNRHENKLTSDLVTYSFEPDHCDFYINYEEEHLPNYQIDLEKGNVKSDETHYGTESEGIEYETEYLSETDDISNNIEKRDVMDKNRKSCDVHSIAREMYHNVQTNRLNNAVDINTRNTSNSDIFKSDKNIVSDEDILTISVSDQETEFLDCNIDDNIADHSENYLDLNDDKHNVDDNNKYSDKDNVDLDIDDDDDDEFLSDNDITLNNYNVVSIEDNISKLLQKKDSEIEINLNNNKFASNIRSIFKNKNFTDNTENKVSLSNLIFVKNSTPITQNKKNMESNLENKLPIKKYPVLKKSMLMKQNKNLQSNLENENSLNNLIIVTNTKPMIQHKACETRNDKNEKKSYVTLNNNKRNIFSCDDEYILYQDKSVPTKPKDKKVIGIQTLKKKQVHKTIIPKCKIQKSDFLTKYFTKTELTFEEQLEQIKKRKNMSEFYMIRNPYICGICYSAFRKQSTYILHMERHTDKHGKFKCDICGIRTISRVRLLCHVQGNHTYKYKCKECGQVTSSRDSAKKHHWMHSGKTYKCQHCEMETRSRFRYFKHLRIHSDFPCPLCGQSCASTRGLRFHHDFKHGLEDAQNVSGPVCEICGVQFASEEAYGHHVNVSPKHQSSVSKLKRIRTLNTDKKHKKKSSLKNLRKIPQNREKFICEFCGRAYYAQSLLKEHMQWHQGIYPEENRCKICNKRFVHKFQCKKHVEQIHTNPQRYPCKLCPRQFSSLGNRSRHMKLHGTDREMVNCNICDKSFTTKAGLEQHVTHVHLNVPWPRKGKPQASRFSVQDKTVRLKQASEAQMSRDYSEHMDEDKESNMSLANTNSADETDEENILRPKRVQHSPVKYVRLPKKVSHRKTSEPQASRNSAEDAEDFNVAAYETVATDDDIVLVYDTVA